ncbi:MAG: hypothetical protein WC374_06575 [Phycisphaerae bacterium]|jgi:hypothetical protein
MKIRCYGDCRYYCNDDVCRKDNELAKDITDIDLAETVKHDGSYRRCPLYSPFTKKELREFAEVERAYEEECVRRYEEEKKHEAEHPDNGDYDDINLDACFDDVKYEMLKEADNRRMLRAMDRHIQGLL